MKSRSLVLAFLAATLCSGAVAQSPNHGYWRAASATASSITGDISLSETKLTINFTPFTLAPIRSLKPAEISAVFAAEDQPGTGNLYRLDVPAQRRFLHKNSLCGSDDAEWMVTNLIGKTLYVAFFSGSDSPTFTIDAMNQGTNLCGTFTYVR